MGDPNPTFTEPRINTMNQTMKYSDIAGDHPEAADQHEPETIGALLDARHALMRASSALTSHPAGSLPRPVQNTVSRIAAAAALNARDLDSVLHLLRAGLR